MQRRIVGDEITLIDRSPGIQKQAGQTDAPAPCCLTERAAHWCEYVDLRAAFKQQLRQRFVAEERGPHQRRTSAAKNEAVHVHVGPGVDVRPRFD